MVLHTTLSEMGLVYKFLWKGFAGVCAQLTKMDVAQELCITPNKMGVVWGCVPPIWNGNSMWGVHKPLWNQELHATPTEMGYALQLVASQSPKVLQISLYIEAPWSSIIIGVGWRGQCGKRIIFARNGIKCPDQYRKVRWGRGDQFILVFIRNCMV